ncbi:hypothetical protein FQA39_LY04968 [Lamprigera yunnana]|nr:hypothetical protein FQA39_LY04968 [Lamprigera yunnana]
METEAFNTDLFIDEIKKRPVIWNMTSSIYSDQNITRRAWEDLVLIFCEGDDNEKKMKLLYNYMKVIKKMKTVKSGSGASKNSSYIHYNRLRFLKASKANKDTECSFDADNASASSEVADVEVSSAFKSRKSTPRRKQKISTAKERFANIVEQSLA